MSFRKNGAIENWEDNWRRANKSASLFAEEPNPENVSSEMMMDSTSSTLSITDNKNPAFYLKQIPLTPLQLKISNEQWHRQCLMWEKFIMKKFRIFLLQFGL
jgi:hypothetical protein